MEMEQDNYLHHQISANWKALMEMGSACSVYVNNKINRTLTSKLTGQSYHQIVTNKNNSILFKTTPFL
jgi:hypothetical protein